MRATSAPKPKKKGGIPAAVGLVIIIVAAIVIVTAAYFFTRPGGVAGKKGGNELWEERAQKRGYANMAEMMKAGGPWAPPKSELGKAGKKGHRTGPRNVAPAGEQGK